MQRPAHIFHDWLFVLLIALSVLPSCSEPRQDPLVVQILQSSVELNPYRIAPLTARIHLELSAPAKVAVTLQGRQGPESDVAHTFSDINTVHEIPVLGLYPGVTNVVELVLMDATGVTVGSDQLEIETIPLLHDLPQIAIEQRVAGMLPGMTLVSYYGHNGSITPQRPFMFDQFGDIRWYLDFRSYPLLANAFLDVGVERLINGNLYFGDASTNRIYEMTMLGEVVNVWDMPGFGFHHNVQEMPNGNFLVTASKFGVNSVQDHILEIDRQNNEIVRVWDLRQSLDAQRRTMTSDGYDWIHVNSVYYDPGDNCIVISGRTQGVFKLTMDNQLVWILAPHAEWTTAGNGVDMNAYLLQPLDRNGDPIVDQAVLTGERDHADFDWPWYQHAAAVQGNGNISLFDNGFRRFFAWNTRYSRAVEYAVNTETMTVRQVWSYGRERGEDTFSRITSDVDLRRDQDRVFFSPGSISQGGVHRGKVVELLYASQQVVFEASIYPPMPAWEITFHRTERMPLYPD